MIAILMILIITLAAAVFAVLGLRYALSDNKQERVLPPPDARGLFFDPASENDAAHRVQKKSVNPSIQREQLIERARQGDLASLSDARALNDVRLYDEALDALIEQASGRQESFSALVNYIAKSDELRANAELVERVLESWKAAPARQSTVEMLHIAALSNDAVTYQKTVKEVLGFWQDRRLTDMSAEELLALVESEYWILASEARLGGAGFALKRMLADVRRKLAAATPAR